MITEADKAEIRMMDLAVKHGLAGKSDADFDAAWNAVPEPDKAEILRAVKEFAQRRFADAGVVPKLN